jgi:hypothetical protein
MRRSPKLFAQPDIDQSFSRYALLVSTFGQVFSQFRLQGCQKNTPLDVHVEARFFGQIPVIAKIVGIPEFRRFFDGFEFLRDWVAFFLPCFRSEVSACDVNAWRVFG